MKRKKILPFIWLIGGLLSLSFVSCGDSEEGNDPPVIIHTPKPQYLNLLPNKANNMTVTELSGENHYSLSTTGQDPYVFTSTLAKANPADSVVLCFEYKSNKDLEFVQIFFADPISEARSVKTTTLPKSTTWKQWGIVLKKELTSHSWGYPGNYLRLDFGNDPGYEMEIRNIYFRTMNSAEKAVEDAREAAVERDRKLGENLKRYLAASYTSTITEVVAEAQKITVKGTYTGDGEFLLCEVPPYTDVTETSEFAYTTPLKSSSFTETFDKYIVRDGIRYDRALSKWVIVKKESGSHTIVSHARYAGQFAAAYVTQPEKPATQKGLGGFFNHGTQVKDLDDLGITSVTINVPFTAYMHSKPGNNRIEHEYGAKKYYFDKNQIEALDRSLRECFKRNIVVAAILLVQPAANCADKEIGKILQHPDYISGFYTMPDMTNPESVNTYAAALDFLAARYSGDKGYGRIHHWIMHNEVDAGFEWTNMGADKPMLVYTDAYMKSMRMCYNIARQYDRYSEVFGSFTHSWTQPVNVGYYASLEMLQAFNSYCKAEGDFQWALAYHCYPQDLNEPKTWNDTGASYSPRTPLITFKNLEVLDLWIKQKENFYMGSTKRTLWLSENGTNSRTYGEQDMLEQAAGFAWGWTKIRQLDGIDGIQWHNWADNEQEFGLRIGLRKFSSHNLEPKEVWYAYKAAGTAEEQKVFAKYLPVIGIQNWDIMKSVK